MSAKRFTGKTESDAVMNAAMELGIPSTDLKYTVIDSGSNGFLGVFKKPVIIEIKEEEKEVCAYGMELIISGIISVALVIIIGLITGNIWYAVIYNMMMILF